MRIDPLVAGVCGGLAATLLLAPATGSALGRLAAARGERVRIAQAAALAERAPAPLVAPGAAVGGPAALAARIRARAKAGGVLVEEATPLARGGLAVVRLRLSGAEKSMVALADSLERDAALLRLRDWRLEAIPGGGVRLSGEAVGARR